MPFRENEKIVANHQKSIGENGHNDDILGRMTKNNGCILSKMLFDFAAPACFDAAFPRFFAKVLVWT